jgi:hypothetical protein
MKIAEENLDDDNDDDILTSQASGSCLGNTVVFKGFESLYKQVVDIEDQLLCSEVKKRLRKHSMILESCLNHFKVRSGLSP